jgi:hypothetical protein
VAFHEPDAEKLAECVKVFERLNAGSGTDGIGVPATFACSF